MVIYPILINVFDDGVPHLPVHVNHQNTLSSTDKQTAKQLKLRLLPTATSL